MSDWFKVRCDFTRHRKIRWISNEAKLLFIGLLAQNHERGEGGVIPGQYCGPRDLAHEHHSLNLEPSSVDRILEELVEEKLIKISGDGSIHILGYDEEFMPACSRCHNPNPEPRFRRCRECRDYDRDRRAQSSAPDARAQRAQTLLKTGQYQDRTETETETGSGSEGNGAPPPAAETDSHEIGLFLRGVRWGNSDLERIEKSMKLGRRWTVDDLQAVWDHSESKARDPIRYFAKIIQSEDKIWEIVKTTQKRKR